MPPQLISCLGLVVMIFLAWLMSSRRRQLPWRIIVGGLALQFALAVLILWTPPGKLAFKAAGDFFHQLLGVKMFANEFVAYNQLGIWIQDDSPVQLSERSQYILTYALSGFSNFGAIGIQIGGIGGIAPTRSSDLAQLGLRAMLGGALACCMTACVAGILI